MYRQDFIIRLIEQFGQAMAALFSRLKGREVTPAEARARISEVAAQSGLDPDVARGLDPAMLLMWLAPLGEIDPGKFWLMAELLLLDGLQARQDGDAGRAEADFERARLILSNLEADWRASDGLASAGERLEEVERLLEPGR